MYKLLLVEDEKPLLDKIVNNVCWREHNYQVYQSGSAEEALDILNKEKIDILVTDIRMPGLSGIDLIRRVADRDLITIIISGHAEFEYARQSLRLGVNDYLLKPFTTARLLKVVNTARNKLIKEREERQSLKNLRMEISKFMKKKEWFDQEIINKLISPEMENIYREQILLLQNEGIFKELKHGKKEDLIQKVNGLFYDLRQTPISEEHFIIFISSFVLMTFKCLKDMDFNLGEIIKILEEKIVFPDFQGFNLEYMEEWLIDFLLKVDSFITRKRLEGQDLVVKIKKVIKEELPEGITLGKLAKRFNMSSSGLSQFFRKQTGKNFSEYIDDLRLDRAKEMLKTSDKKIYEIADSIGFDDPYYFSVWFKKRMDVSPTTYRENFILLDN